MQKQIKNVRQLLFWFIDWYIESAFFSVKVQNTFNFMISEVWNLFAHYASSVVFYYIDRQFCRGEKESENFGSRLETQNTHQNIYIFRHHLRVISLGLNYDKTDINCAIIIVTMHFTFVWNIWQTSWESFWPMPMAESFPTHDA